MTCSPAVVSACLLAQAVEKDADLRCAAHIVDARKRLPQKRTDVRIPRLMSGGFSVRHKLNKSTFFGDVPKYMHNGRQEDDLVYGKDTAFYAKVAQ